MAQDRVVFVNGEKRELLVEAHQVFGNKPDDKGDSYTFRNGSIVRAVVRKTRFSTSSKSTMPSDDSTHGPDDRPHELSSEVGNKDN